MHNKTRTKHKPPTNNWSNNKQLMHSFEVNIWICQPENSEHHFSGLENPDVNRKRTSIVLLYDTVSLFLVLFKVFSCL